jgi:hypothetical protein
MAGEPFYPAEVREKSGIFSRKIGCRMLLGEILRFEASGVRKPS